MLSKDYVIQADVTIEKYLFDTMNCYVLNVFNIRIKGGQAIIILRKPDNVMDGREVWIGLIDFYKRNSNIYLVRNQCQT